MGVLSRIRDLEIRVDKLEVKFEGLERHFTEDLDSLGGYKHKSEAELAEIRGQLSSIVSTLESLVSNAENQDDAARARSLLRRARNNLTRATKAAG